MKENMYCGIGPVPKGRTRGTPEYCVQTNQVRYYGLVAIDEDLLRQAKGNITDLTKEKLKIKKLEDDAKLLIKDVKNIKIIIESDDSTPSQRKNAQKKMDDLLEKRDKLIKKLKEQSLLVKELEKDIERREKARESNKKKSTTSGSKTVKKPSGSKTVKKSSGSKTVKKSSGSKTVKKSSSKTAKKSSGSKK
jgi:hypothetical protein